MALAQLVERTTENREVTGSTPVGATISSLETLAPAGVFALSTERIRSTAHLGWEITGVVYPGCGV